MERKKILSTMEVIKYLPEDIVKEMKILRYEKGDIISLDAFHTGTAWKIIEGSIKATIFTQHGQEFNGEFRRNEWFGTASVLVENPGSIDVEALEACVLVSLPLKLMIDRYPEETKNLWEMIAKGAAIEYNRILSGSISKALLTNEGYFLKYLKDNNNKIKFENTKELSELLNTNLRTVQRIVKKLKAMGIIEKGRREIRVLDENKFEEHYINEVESV